MKRRILLFLMLFLCLATTTVCAKDRETRAICDIYMKDGTTMKRMNFIIPAPKEKTVTIYKDGKKMKLKSTDIDYFVMYHRALSPKEGYVFRYSPWVEKMFKKHPKVTSKVYWMYCSGGGKRVTVWTAVDINYSIMKNGELRTKMKNVFETLLWKEGDAYPAEVPLKLFGNYDKDFLYKYFEGNARCKQLIDKNGGFPNPGFIEELAKNY